jgi:hypothetical protein
VAEYIGSLYAIIFVGVKKRLKVKTFISVTIVEVNEF